MPKKYEDLCKQYEVKNNNKNVIYSVEHSFGILI